MNDPVITADGYSYERAAITAWFAIFEQNPFTNEVLANKELIPNFALKNTIESLIKNLPQAQKIEIEKSRSKVDLKSRFDALSRKLMPVQGVHTKVKE